MVVVVDEREWEECKNDSKMLRVPHSRIKTGAGEQLSAESGSGKLEKTPEEYVGANEEDDGFDYKDWAEKWGKITVQERDP